MSVNTTTVTNGSHTFGARAYDAAGNIGTGSQRDGHRVERVCAWLQPQRHSVELHRPGQRGHRRPDSVSSLPGNYGTWTGTNKAITVAAA